MSPASLPGEAGYGFGISGRRSRAPTMSAPLRLDPIEPLRHQGAEGCRLLDVAVVARTVEHRERRVRVVLEQSPRVAEAGRAVLTSGEDEDRRVIRHALGLAGERAGPALPDPLQRRYVGHGG